MQSNKKCIYFLFFICPPEGFRRSFIKSHKKKLNNGFFMRNLAIVAQEAHYNLRLCTISKIYFTFKIVTFKHLKIDKILNL